VYQLIGHSRSAERRLVAAKPAAAAAVNGASNGTTAHVKAVGAAPAPAPAPAGAGAGGSDAAVLKYLRSDLHSLEEYTPVKPFDVLAKEIGLPMESIIKLDANEACAYQCISQYG